MNFTLWGELRLAGALLAICSFFIGVGADVSLDSSFEIGNLSTISEIFALVKLYNGLNQESWRQLGDETWHKSAFQSFFAVGPLDANQMNALAAQNNKPDTWNSSNVTVSATSDLITRLKAISTTHYQMSRSITGTGNIKASMWTLMFSCGSTSCSDGYMVPILAAEQGTKLYSYVTAWLPVTDGVLMNAIPASISKKATQTINFNPTQKPDPNRPSISFNIQEYLPTCPKARVRSFRTLLDSAYGLAPAITCLGFSDDESFKITVTSSASLGNVSSDGSTVKQTLESLAKLQVNVSEWLPEPFEKCSHRPLLILSEGSDSLPHMCHHNKCMVFFPIKDSNPQNQTGVQFLKGLEKVLDEGPSVHECASISNGITTCDSLYNISSFYDLDSTEPFTSSFRSSDWAASEEGNRTSEFYYAPHGENLTACAIELTPPLSQLKPPRKIQIQAIDYLTAYIREHNTAFTTDKGPATDPYTFYALLITTALSVIGIAVPFTNVMLGAICRVRPVYFNMKKGGGSRAAKVVIQVCCNVGLTLLFFLPVISLARNEMERQKEFSTWALASDDVVGADHDLISPTEAPMRVVYLFALSSQYHSKFLVVIVLVMCFTCLFVAVCTAWRCLHVFARYRLLTSGSHEPKLTAIQQALKAIEMGDAEYLDLKLNIMHAGAVRHSGMKSYYLLDYSTVAKHGLEY